MDPYTALSYCWGKVGNLATTTEAISNRKDDIPWGVLPLTVQDAIRITRRQIRYIWIDAQSIVQNSVEDWNDEAAKMAERIQGAHLVITATRSAIVRASMFGPRMPVVFENWTKIQLLLPLSILKCIRQECFQ
ncbi:hypothetical protein BBP40_006716 [Aspergillus hancockii]|nr:hypothetical protein BBP40_006716 [Aspergillus hancockii]